LRSLNKSTKLKRLPLLLPRKRLLLPRRQKSFKFLRSKSSKKLLKSNKKLPLKSLLWRSKLLPNRLSKFR
jgi:hypothetical protein